MIALMANAPTTEYKVSSRRGFTLVEVMITLTLTMLISIGVFGTITTLHQISRSQAVYNSVLALVMQEQEAIRADGYTTPSTRYPSGATPNIETDTSKSVSLNSSGTDTLVDVTLVSSFVTASSGHLVTVSATYTYSGKTITIETTTLINNFSSTSS